MTRQANTLIETEVVESTIILKLGNKTFKLPVTDVTHVTDALLAARKVAYDAQRGQREAAKAEVKAAKQAAKAAKIQAKRDALQAQLDALTA